MKILVHVGQDDKKMFYKKNKTHKMRCLLIFYIKRRFHSALFLQSVSKICLNQIPLGQNNVRSCVQANPEKIYISSLVLCLCGKLYVYTKRMKINTML